MAELPTTDETKEGESSVVYENSVSKEETSPSSLLSLSLSSSLSSLSQALLQSKPKIFRATTERTKNQLNTTRRQEESKKRHRLLSQEVDPARAVCFVSIDAGMGSDLLNIKVLKRLEQLFSTTQNKLLCRLENLSISGTHTHAAPAGFLQYTTYQVTSLGFVQETMDAYVEGIAQSIVRAHDNLQPGTLSTASGLLRDANINRSPTSYLLNPKEEIDSYADQGDTDKNMLLLKFSSNSGDDGSRDSSDNTDMGVLAWFAVHGTSMNFTNQLISGDNKGYASYLMEKQMNGKKCLAGKGHFVAAFASTNLGDVSPNTNGPRCIDTGLPCDRVTSTCRGKSQLCIASGPGKDMFESTQIIGQRQFEHAAKLYQNANVPIQGHIGFRHSFVDMSNLEITLANGEKVRTCPAALGYSFAAGTTDGHGDFNFSQSTNTSNPFWNLVAGFLSRPSRAQKECQEPKPILLNIGEAKFPYDWVASIVPISIFRIGQLFILNVPCEFTTMAGRRLRRAVEKVVEAHGGLPPEEKPIVTIAGLSNSYTHYVTTQEEYADQRYEAASTLYGKHTLAGYIQEFERITRDLLLDRPSQTTLPPPDLSKKQRTLLPKVVFDTVPPFTKFGNVVRDAEKSYIRGIDRVEVEFRSANPRNNPRLEGSFLSIERRTSIQGSDAWETVFVDGDWSTRYSWKGHALNPVSYAHIIWDVPGDVEPGFYRVCHSGTRKTLVGHVPLTIHYVIHWLSVTLVAVSIYGIAAQLLDFLSSYSTHFHSWVDGLLRPRLVDFTGCSQQFEIKAE